MPSVEKIVILFISISLIMIFNTHHLYAENNICHCLRYSETEGLEWGNFEIMPQDLPNNTECIIIFIVAQSNEIVELRFLDIQLRQECLDEIRIYPHLKNTIITDTTLHEDVICANNATDYFSSNTTISPKVKDPMQSSKMADLKKKLKLIEGNIFNVLLFKKAIFSSDSVMAIQIFHHNITTFSNENFSISGKFRYISKDLYRTTGNLLSTTYCDYQFLPHSTNFAREHKVENAIFRHFYSPRFPAKYPSHVKCLYKFIGRPQNRIEIIFDGIILQRDNRSCINHLDKITVYDSKTLNKSTTIDVFCDVKWNKRILSSGPYLLIEFETSSNHTSYGFSAKYRFNEIEEKGNSHSTPIYLRTTVQPTVNIADNYVAVSQQKLLPHPKSYASNCDVVLQSSVASKGTIQTPLNLGTYSSKTVCRYEFQGKPQERIQISFAEFLFPPRKGKDCGESDVIQIYEKLRDEFELIDVLCGGITPKPIMSSGSNLILEFHGTHISNKNKGFKADYEFLTNFGISTGYQLPDHPCSFTYNSTNIKSGWFNSPNYPGTYPKNIECFYYFYGAPMERVAIRFTYFDIEGIPPCSIDSASDYLEFSNFVTKDRKYPRYCGETKGFTIKSDGKFFRILFKSNTLLDGTGFKAFYIFETDKLTTEPIDVDAGCGKLIPMILEIFLLILFVRKCILYV
ncbi:suppressor of lurcher protein 1 [Lutzomyia longipalpis]|uniref:suppressor of lurcher protein 1 n=1 Tax=Lutzomyia longipalpis TaxID=7200 RepID=UPI002483656A|nr:suppressor of lurcher protein 1 [Lutzomyia longipalpis]